MKKIFYIILGIIILYYGIKHFPIKSYEEFTSYIYTGKVEDTENSQNFQKENNKEKIDISQEEKKRQINEILGVQEEEKPKTFKDRIVDKYKEIKQKVENLINNIKIFFTKENKEGE
jgi:gas vesicle protein